MFKKNELNKDAISQLFSENYRRVYKIAFSRTYDKELSKDITQITFMRAFEGIYKLKDKTKFNAWVCAIAVNVSKDMLRQKIKNKNRYISLFDEDGNIQDYLYEMADGNSLEEQYEAMEIVRDIFKYANKLSLEEKQIIHMKYIENHTYSEIAKRMRMKQSSVGMKLLRIRKKIGNALESR